jgi:hypothetical protein
MNFLAIRILLSRIENDLLSSWSTRIAGIVREDGRLTLSPDVTIEVRDGEAVFTNPNVSTTERRNFHAAARRYRNRVYGRLQARPF